jgi:hypothetical protein
MHKQRFGQAHCIDLLNRIHTLIFWTFVCNSINFLSLLVFLGFNLIQKDFKTGAQYWAQSGLRPNTAGLALLCTQGGSPNGGSRMLRLAA